MASKYRFWVFGLSLNFNSGTFQGHFFRKLSSFKDKQKYGQSRIRIEVSSQTKYARCAVKLIELNLLRNKSFIGFWITRLE